MLRHMMNHKVAKKWDQGFEATRWIIADTLRGTDAACFARASDSPFFRLARAFSWLHIFSVNKTLWISRLCTSDSPSVFEAETNKIYVRTALVLVLVMT